MGVWAGQGTAQPSPRGQAREVAGWDRNPMQRERVPGRCLRDSQREAQSASSAAVSVSHVLHLPIHVEILDAVKYFFQLEGMEIQATLGILKSLLPPESAFKHCSSI